MAHPPSLPYHFLTLPYTLTPFLPPSLPPSLTYMYVPSSSDLSSREEALAEMGIAIQDREGRAVGVMQPKRVG